MTSEKFVVENVQYKAIGDGLTILNRLKGDFDHIIVQSEAISPCGSKYKIIGFSDRDYSHYSEHKAESVSFCDDSEIQEVPLSLINSCKISFSLPRNTKRVKGDHNCFHKCPLIICNQKNQFVSIESKNIIINLHPLELLNQNCSRPCFLIRETVRTIGTGAFSYNNFLRFIFFPASVEVIGNSAFDSCENLERVEFKQGSKLKQIKSLAFYGTSISKITFPPNVERIGHSAFSGCRKLKIVSFPKDIKLTKIESSAFYEAAIEKIEIPASVEEIGNNAFYGCRELTSVTFAEDSKLREIGGTAFYETRIKSIVFPSSVEEIGNSTFSDCDDLTSIEFEEGSRLKKIGGAAFRYTGIRSVTLPSEIEEIEDSAFEGCQNLKEVNFLGQKSFIKFGEDVFSGCIYSLS